MWGIEISLLSAERQAALIFEKQDHRGISLKGEKKNKMSSELLRTVRRGEKKENVAFSNIGT